ncbi:unnamed protein product [Phytomonas sp. EM1]|nr:unnamed protein product [Phytomonas sp. EM1]|eukprot:CCW63835.1 unnamed protein product [Phytomonas sp. isolate EM1]
MKLSNRRSVLPIVLAFLCLFLTEIIQLKCYALAEYIKSTRYSYDIVFSPSPIDPNDLMKIPDHSIYPMRNANGSSYICTLPDETMRGFSKESESTRTLTPGSLVPAEVINEVSKSLEETCMEATSSSLLYRFCWERFIIQTQLDLVAGLSRGSPNSIGIPTITIGYQKDPIGTSFTYELDSTGAYFRTFFTDGTSCPLIGRNRETEVQLRCLSYTSRAIRKRYLLEISEISTCRYLLKLYIPEACVPQLKAKTIDHSVVCFPYEGR